MQIYLARNNQQAGPYTLEQLNQMLSSQQVLLTDLAWHQGMTEWKALGELTQGQLTYQPAGYTPPTPAPTAFQQPVATAQKSTNVASQTLASIPSRALAKIIDLLLWLPATYILTSFFSAQETEAFNKLNEQFITAVMDASTNPTVIQNLQNQIFDMFSQQAWMAMTAYLVIMLMVQAYFITKSGQSIGKKITKIQIVDAESGEQVSTLRAFTLRSIVFILINFMFLMVAIVDYLFAFGAKRQTLHDKLAKTKVIKQQK
ncbi:RDD family protein [Acinetobacter cumulans]|uniref:RDD family protein n=1 Tax=Acinetobacter cumulans TaxID=2136182 RepID=A0A498CYF2_9GAMM|nr:MULTISPECIES: RDD family protein [Acinetobacter]NWK73701.1 RDD family protein [Acinetobacter sp. SwsAc6]RLL36858.1 RDD family protein [Acinetobacter cumulans]RLL48835.1 RDD family protein [Acinetobacter cumulans]